METIQEIDVYLLLLVQKLSSPFFDFLMIGLSNFKSWIPICFFVIFQIFKERPPKQSFAILLFIVLGISLADYITSGLMKPYFGRLRPCHEPALNEIVRIVNGCGGQYGFASGHAATAFALCFGSILHLKISKIGKISFTLWASMVALSRVYLGVHYMTDIVVGACIGTLISFVILWIKTKQKHNI